MYKYKGSKILNNIKELDKKENIFLIEDCIKIFIDNFDKKKHSLKLYYEAEYNLEWTSLHYGEDDVLLSSHVYFNSGPQDIKLKNIILEIYLNDLKLNEIKLDNKELFNLIIEDLKKDAKEKYY